MKIEGEANTSKYTVNNKFKVIIFAYPVYKIQYYSIISDLLFLKCLFNRDVLYNLSSIFFLSFILIKMPLCTFRFLSFPDFRIQFFNGCRR